MKPITRPPSERYLRNVARLDRLIVALVLLLAFLLGAFPARNSDVWRHLASGARLTVLQPGVDPFNFTTGDEYWVNHGWLFDTMLYLVTLPGGPEGAGGVLASLLKAAAVVALAGLMMSVRRPNQGPWAPAAVTTLALVVLSPGLELRPMLASLLLLAATLAVLAREGKPPAEACPPGWRRLWSRDPGRLWVLPVLFVLWVNLHDWFWLGPLAVACFLLGEVLQERWQPIYSREDAATPAERRMLKRVLAVGLAVCLLNPYLWRAFTLPIELQAGGFVALRGDPEFVTYFTGPFSGGYFTPQTGISVAGLAYYFLLALTASSFLLNWGGWRWRRVTVVAPFALLSMLHMRLIPFFAVAAGPIIALNIQDFIELEMTRRIAEDPGWRRTAVAGRGITLQTLVVFLLLAWAGWLHTPQAQRRFGLGIHAEPSMRAAALELQAHSVGPQRMVNLHSGLADYLAWFAPDVRSYFDSRLPLMSRSLPGYVRLRSPSQDVFQAAWRDVRQRWDVQGAALYGPTAAQTALPFSWLIQDGLSLVWFDGRAALFRIADPSWPPHDPTPLAFGPQASQASPQGPDRPPSINYLEHFLFGPPARPLDTDLSEAYIQYYRHEGMRQRGQDLVRVAGLVGLPGHPATLALLIGMQPELARPAERGPAGVPLLAVRSARRALAENPDDGAAALYLMEAYDVLWRVQENHWAGVAAFREISPPLLLRFLGSRKGPMPSSPWVSRRVDPRQILRQAQVAAALRYYLQIDPDSAYAHRTLHLLFWRMGYYDLALEHLQAEVAALRRQLDPRDATLQERENELLRREQEVDLLRRTYAQSTSPQWGAFQPFGLVNTAMQQTREGKGVLQPPEVDQYLYLLLTTGRIDDLDDFLRRNPDLPKMIGPRFQWYSAMLAAARGNYREADRLFEQSAQGLPSPAEPLGKLLQSLTADQLATPVLAQVLLRPYLREQATHQAAALTLIIEEGADVQFLRGLLALEQGDTASARRLLQASLTAAGPDAPFAAVAERYLEHLNAAAD